MSILITNGRLIDQAGDRAADVRVDAGTIVEVCNRPMVTM